MLKAGEDEAHDDASSQTQAHSDPPLASTVCGPHAARRAARPIPGFIAPCNPTLKSVVPTGERWLYEIKHDGYRIQAHLVEGKPALLTSSGLNWTGRFRSLVAPLNELPASSIISTTKWWSRMRRALLQAELGG